MVVTSNNGSQTSQNFAAAYGFIIQSSTVPMYHNYAAKLRTQNMSILCISCAGNQGTLQGNYGDTVKHFAFIIDQACLIKNKVSQHFFEVLVPDAAGPVQFLGGSVHVRGRRGWILNTCVITNESLNPVLYAKGDPTNKSVHPLSIH